MMRIDDVLELAVDVSLAGVGGVEAVEDRHQRRFAGAVFPDDAVDGATRDLEIDVAVGPDGAEALVNASELNRRSNSAPGGALRGVGWNVWRSHVTPITGTGCRSGSRAP